MACKFSRCFVRNVKRPCSALGVRRLDGYLFPFERTVGLCVFVKGVVNLSKVSEVVLVRFSFVERLNCPLECEPSLGDAAAVFFVPGRSLSLSLRRVASPAVVSLSTWWGGYSSFRYLFPFSRMCICTRILLF